MQISELRIGNIIKHNVKDEESPTGFCEPNEDQISEDDMWHLTGGNNDKGEFVPITVEWLEKLGFKLVRHDWDFYTKDFRKSGMNSLSFRLWFNKGWCIGIYESSGSIDIHIQYMHELQNLWLVFTKEELISTGDCS